MIAWWVPAGLGAAIVSFVLVRRATALGLGLASAAWAVVVVPESAREFGAGHPEVTVAVIVAVALTTARGGRARTDEPRRSAMVLTAGAAAVTVSGLVLGGPDTGAAALAGFGALAVLPWLAGRYLGRRDLMVEGGWERAQRWESIAADAQHRERVRIAGEMHDVVGHELARAALQLGALELDSRLDDGHRERVGCAREGVSAAARRLSETVRILQTARPPETRGVAELVDGARDAGVAVSCSGDDLDAVAADALVTETLRRVVQESLTNAIKHAPGAPVAITGSIDDATVELRITNPHTGGPVGATGGGTGLVRLAERVRLLGGRWSAGHDAGGTHFVVSARLPRCVGPDPGLAAEPGTLDSVTTAERHSAAREVRRARRRIAVATAAMVLTTTAAAVTYVTLDAVTSTLAPADFDALVLGTPRPLVEPVLPSRPRVDDPTAVPPEPRGATCEYYSTHVAPFDARRLDLFRLCFREDRLVTKDLVSRG